MESLLQSCEKHQEIAQKISEAESYNMDEADFSFYTGPDPNKDQFSHYEIFVHAMDMAYKCEIENVEVWQIEIEDYVYFFIGSEESVTDRLEGILTEATNEIKMDNQINLIKSSKKHQDLMNKILKIKDGLWCMEMLDMPDASCYNGLEDHGKRHYDTFASAIDLINKILSNSTIINDNFLSAKGFVIEEAIWKVDVDSDATYFFVGTEDSVYLKLKRALNEAKRKSKNETA